jgi:hypothetical protein
MTHGLREYCFNISGNLRLVLPLHPMDRALCVDTFNIREALYVLLLNHSMLVLCTYLLTYSLHGVGYSLKS